MFSAPSVTVKAIGLFLKNSALHSRVSSCSSRTSKVNGGTGVDAQTPSPPLKFYPSTSNTHNNKHNGVNYHSHGNLVSTDAARQMYVRTPGSPNGMPPSKSQHSTTTDTG